MRRRATRKRAAAKPARLERVKWTPRVDPQDVRRFQAVREEMVEAEQRRVSDAEVFRLAVSALVESLDDDTRARLTTV